MKEIYTVAVLFVATLVAFTFGQEIPTKCPKVDSVRTTVHLAHESDCTKFYMCQMGRKIGPMNCPYMDKDGSRLHFNPRLQVCDWPYRAGCKNGKSSTTTSTTTTSTEPTTTTTTTTAEPSTPSTIPTWSITPDTSTSSDDSIITITLTPSTKKATYNPPIRTITPAPLTTTKPTKRMTTTKPTKRTTTTTTTTTPKTPSGETCPKDTGGKTIKIRHETRCESYYLCTDGEKVMQTCRSGTAFNPLIKNCDHKENVDCSGITIMPTVKPTPNKCPPKGSSKRAMLPHECQCDKYYECRDGDMILRKCPSGMHYDYIREICDLPKLVNCVRPIPTTMVMSVPTTVSYDECSSENEGQRYQDESSCTTYYECVNKQKVLKYCAPGLHFNVTLQLCEYPEKECAIITPTSPGTSTTRITVTTESTSTNACPPKGSKKEVRLPHECFCSDYYECDDGLQVRKSCPSGLNYDYIWEICDEPTVVICDLPTFPTDITANTTTAATSSGKTKGTSSSASENTARDTTSSLDDTTGTTPAITFPVTTSSPITPMPGLCPPKGSTEKVLLPHECSCTDYYECVDGFVIRRRCPSGLHFDYVRQVCDLPYIVKCVRPIPPTTSTKYNTDTTTGITYSTSQITSQSTTAATTGTTSRATTTIVPTTSTQETITPTQITTSTTQGTNTPTQRTTTTTQGTTTTTSGTSTLRWITTTSRQGTSTSKQFTTTTQGTITPTTTLGTSTPTWITTTTRQGTSTPKQFTTTTQGTTTPTTTLGTSTPTWITTTTRQGTSTPKQFTTTTQGTTTTLGTSTPTWITTTTRHGTSTSKQFTTTTQGTTTPTQTTTTTTQETITPTRTTSTKSSIPTYKTTTTEATETPTRQTTTPTTTVMTEKPTSTTQSSRGPTTDSTTIWTTTTSSIPSTCPPKGSTEKVLLPHECLCTDYYECMDGLEIHRHCPIGLHFDYVRQTCDEPEIAKCVRRPIPSTTTAGTTTTYTETTTCGMPSFTHDIADTYTSIQNVCPPKGSTEKIEWAHECSCKQYYECFDGLQVIRKCPPGQHYDYVHQTCGDPKVVNCVRPIPPPTRPTTPPVINDGECPHDDTKIVKFPHKTDCRLYYQCMDGKKVLKSCRYGHVFNPLLGTCDFPENVKGCGSTYKEPNTDFTAESTNTCPPAGSPEERKLPHECECTKYYVCYNGEMVLQVCPAGLHYDYKYATCDKPENVHCVRPTSNPTKLPDINVSPALLWCANKPDDTQVPHEFDCSSYYMCKNGHTILKRCRNGLHYNPLIGVCDFPNNVNCSSSGKSDLYKCPETGVGKVPHEKDCKLYYDCYDGEKTLRKCRHDLHFNPILKVCDFPENYPCEEGEIVNMAKIHEETGCIGRCPWQDPTNYTVLIPNTDCHKFCMCSNGVPYVQSCPDKLQFDYVRQVCDYPHKVTCKIPPQQELETEEVAKNEDVGKGDDLLNNEKENDKKETEETRGSSWFRLPIFNRYI
ncbi:mucin-2-like isoform X2 [Harpegnathos saltator]|uniref:mucin-2-like isoform X2 n=1 Tax=Harpegnathos saltator TaxID=610380 RepID=UPI000DBEE801|nr:mucin-2-like isoform X2 [Harpegnathos saltator]